MANSPTFHENMIAIPRTHRMYLLAKCACNRHGFDEILMYPLPGHIRRHCDEMLHCQSANVSGWLRAACLVLFSCIVTYWWRKVSRQYRLLQSFGSSVISVLTVLHRSIGIQGQNEGRLSAIHGERGPQRQVCIRR